MRHQLDKSATVINAPLTSRRVGDTSWLWYSIEKMPAEKIDMVIVDGPPSVTQRLGRYPAGPLSIRHLASSGIVFLDDTGRTDEKEIIRRWRQEFPDLIERDHFCEKGCVSLRRTT